MTGTERQHLDSLGAAFRAAYNANIERSETSTEEVVDLAIDYLKAVAKATGQGKLIWSQISPYGLHAATDYACYLIDAKHNPSMVD